MDRSSFRILNILLGNDENEAAIELHFPAGEIVFGSECTFAVTGANFDLHLDGVAIASWKTHRAEVGSVLGFAKRVAGQRAYLGVAGGFEIPAWLGSKSTNLAIRVGGISGRKIAASDCLEFKKPKQPNVQSNLAAGNSITGIRSPVSAVRMTSGPEHLSLTPLSTEVLLSGRFLVSNNSDRMGYRLHGEPLFLMDTPEMISSAVDLGSIQLLPDGQLIVLMADHQTTGGYPRIGHVIRRDIPRLAQLGPGGDLSFELVSVAEAEALELEFERQLLFLKAGRLLRIGE
jgi:antagonist of KipI